MNKRIAARWVERLRSGEIPQGVRHLGAVDGKRCCLGVLCDIAVEDGVIEAPAISEAGRLDSPSPSLSYAGFDSLPHPSIYRWSGIAEGFAQYLAEMNDAGATFEQIADLIEAEYAE